MVHHFSKLRIAQPPLFFLFFILIISANASFAETRYVSDFLVINIRDNIDKPYKVVATVQSNDAVSVLEENDRYLKVETKEGHIGWISKQYVKAELPKTRVIQNLRKEIDSLKDQLRQSGQLEFDRLKESATSPSLHSEDQYAILQADRDSLAAELDSLRSTHEILQTESTGQENTQLISESSFELQEKYDLLLKEKSELVKGRIALIADQEDQQKSFFSQLTEKERLINDLTKLNKRLRTRQSIYWFCAGAAVFLAGIFAGKLSGRKKTRYTY